ncbi:homoserine dehydrogenase [Apilactobacillus ozensis]|uniref:homoserine dehydrogenase n=1 Tax=Apilactobacillus ozensis TaxID=866801 RepID=UPI000B05A5DF|nr:homoserine dehydrogenase [Apilactobacillus ozensis]
MNIAILGFGTVGSGVYKIIQDQKQQKENNLNVSKIFVRDTREKTLPEMTSNINEILHNPDIDLVVETMGGIHPAHEYILAALENKKHVVSANKAVIAQYMQEFLKTAAAHDVKFSFESSVGGGIPWIKNLQRTLRIDEISSIEGIFNGTSNFILDKMHSTGDKFSDALSDAQAIGYAEADPSADIDGYDIVNKLCISLNIAYNTFIQPAQISAIFGIRNITDKDIKNFAEKGYAVKLVGKSYRQGNNFSYVVEPTLYKADATEFSVSNNLNFIKLVGNYIGELAFMGQGAGKLPTANAIIQDINDIQENCISKNYPLDSKININNDIAQGEYIIRTKAPIDKYFDKTKLSNQIMVITTSKIFQWVFSIRLLRNYKKIDSNLFMANISSKLEEANV